MNNLEKMFLENKDRIDFREPAKGHEGRFLRKTGYRWTSSNRSYRILGLSLAASALIAAILFTVFSTEVDQKYAILSEMPEELFEAINFYDNTSAKLEEEIRQLKKNDKSELNRIKKDIKSINLEHSSIMDDYLLYPKDERVQNSLIEAHRNKTELLDDLYHKLLNNEYSKI
jgi:hypothetical protein